MKYRIKEYPFYDGSKYQVQWKMFGLFWVNAGCHYLLPKFDTFAEAQKYILARFDTFAEAQKYIARAEHNHNIKPIIHNK